MSARTALLNPTTSGIKVKGQTIVPQPFAGDLNANMWNTWPWETWLKPQIDLAKSHGANTLALKGGPTGALNGGTSQATIQGRIEQFVEYVGSLGMYVYGHVGQGEGSIATHASNAAFQAGVLDPYDHVLGIDVWNEINIFNEPADHVAAAQTCLAAARAETDLPLTVSVSNALNNSDNSTLLSQLAPHLDFLDIHPYADNLASPPNMAFWTAQSWWKPFIVGEVGSNLHAGASVQTAFYNHLASYYDVVGCSGVVGFSMADYDTEEWGWYDENLVGPRTQVTAPYAAWPSALASEAPALAVRVGGVNRVVTGYRLNGVNRAATALRLNGVNR